MRRQYDNPVTRKRKENLDKTYIIMAKNEGKSRRRVEGILELDLGVSEKVAKSYVEAHMKAGIFHLKDNKIKRGEKDGGIRDRRESVSGDDQEGTQENRSGNKSSKIRSVTTKSGEKVRIKFK